MMVQFIQRTDHAKSLTFNAARINKCPKYEWHKWHTRYPLSDGSKFIRHFKYQLFAYRRRNKQVS